MIVLTLFMCVKHEGVHCHKKECLFNIIVILDKRYLKILQETLLNSVSKNVLPFIDGLNHDSFTLLSVKDAMLYHHL
jgi:hypothetical protein